MLVESASNASIRSQDEIIGANIMREQIELLKNLRDTNWIQFRSWDSLHLATSGTETLFQPNNYYTINNNYTLAKPILVKKLSGISTDKSAIITDISSSSSQIRLCRDNLGRYSHDCTGGNKKTSYASFFQIERLTTKNTSTNTDITVDRAFKVTVFFVSLNK
jgi:hypothetical protein